MGDRGRKPGIARVAVEAVALHQMFYNFTRIHQTLRVTPAMAAGVTDRLWDMNDLVKVLENWEADVATAGTIYDIVPDRIPPGFHVRILTRYGKPREQFGFVTEAEARVFIEAERAKHRPGRRRKTAARA
jgi:hypothetical protein